MVLNNLPHPLRLEHPASRSDIDAPALAEGAGDTGGAEGFLEQLARLATTSLVAGGGV